MCCSWFSSTPFYLKSFISPRVAANNFRPVGHCYYHLMDRNFGLDFPKYLIPLHLAHLLNIWLLWIVARRLGLGALAASAGAFFFGFPPALFGALWEPMYFFDVFCTTLCLSHLLFLLTVAGLGLIALPFLIRDRRLWFGLAAMFLFLLPLLLLPGRLYAVYCYLPLTGLAIALATIANDRYRIVIAVLFLVWIPW